MFVGNLTPIILILDAYEFETLDVVRVSILQNAMLVADLVILVQLFTIGPIGAKLPIVMGTSSGFIGVCQGVAQSMGGGVAAESISASNAGDGLYKRYDGELCQKFVSGVKRNRLRCAVCTVFMLTMNGVK